MWSDDAASDVRATYREALEDGHDDDTAKRKVLEQFADDLADADYRGVVWLALAAAQSNLGRLDDATRSAALEVIDSGADLERWSDAGAEVQRKRKANLDKLRAQLVGTQPERKRVPKRRRAETDLVPGDVLSYRASSGRCHVLVVRALSDTRYGLKPIVSLLDYAADAPPTMPEVNALPERTQGRLAGGDRPADPWWVVTGLVSHKRGANYGDCGFERIGTASAPSSREQERRLKANASYFGWEFLQGYLERQDEALGND